MKTLADLSKNERGKVSELTATGSIRRRLRDLGIVNGTTIVCQGVSTHGDISAYFVKGAVIALRKKDAEKIYIE